MQAIICPGATVFKAHLPKDGLLVEDGSWPQVPFLHFQQPFLISDLLQRGGPSGSLSQSAVEQRSLRQSWLVLDFTCHLARWLQQRTLFLVSYPFFGC